MLGVPPHRPEHHLDPALASDLDLVVGILCMNPNRPTPGLLHSCMARVPPHCLKHHLDPALACDLDPGVCTPCKFPNCFASDLLHSCMLNVAPHCPEHEPDPSLIPTNLGLVLCRLRTIRNGSAPRLLHP
eukprot:1104966-Rhodomonas_salina.1